MVKYKQKKPKIQKKKKKSKVLLAKVSMCILHTAEQIALKTNLPWVNSPKFKTVFIVFGW